MVFSEGAWWIVTVSATVVIAVIGYFLKRTISKTDEHDKDISEIKRKYVTKDELTDTRNELRMEIAAMRQDIKDIKDSTLSKKEFFRSQTSTEGKIDRIYDLLIERGGIRNGPNH